MDSKVPILNPQQIEQLNSMVQGILEENKNTLEHQLSFIVQVENTSILNLYNLVVQEWNKKQKIIENLCHFSLTMMATVQFLWEQKFDHQQKMSTAEHVISGLHQHIQQIGDENEIFKLKMNEAQTHIESISVEKEKFQELYKSQSCCNFAGEGYLSQFLEGNSNVSNVAKQCSACLQNKSYLQIEKSQILDQSSRIIDQKTSEIVSLKEEKKQMESKFEELMEEYKLVKMEVELAEMAIKDALSYRQSSLSSRSQIMSRNDQVFTTRSNPQFMNGQLECFSNFDDSFHIDKSQFLINQELKSDCYYTRNIVSESQLVNDQASANSPFKKKNAEQRKVRTQISQEEQGQQNHPKQSNIKNSQLRLSKNRTVSLQCNLLANIPKLKFLPKRVPKDSRPIENPKILQTPTPTPTALFIGGKKNEKKSSKMMSKSQIIQTKATKQPNSLASLFNFISGKVITNRIKTK